MKKIAALLLTCSLTSGFVFAGEMSSSDQKWLDAVEKMVIKGDRKISTPNEIRVSLLKDWTAKNGYSLKVKKTDAGYAIEVTGKEQAKGIAQK